MKHKIRDLNAPSRWNMRIWDDDKKEWLCQSDEDALTYYGFDITGGEVTEFQGLPKWHPDRHLIWEQSTGLKDKNGKEIYEGDIVKYKLYADSRLDYIDEVFYSTISGAFMVGDEDNIRTLDCLINVEVIGNIHESNMEGEK